MVALGRLRAAAQRMDQVDLGSTAAPYRTMFKRVVETGRPALAANGVNVQLSELIDSTHDATHRQPELKLLPAKLKDFGEMFLPGVALPWGITLVQSAALPAKAEDADMCEVVTVHATPTYYNGRPWYSNVAVDVAEEGGEHATFYAQLRLLFRWGEHELAFIRWYQLLPAEVQEADYLASQGNPLVCWEHPAYQHPSITAAKGKRRKPQTRRRQQRGHSSDSDSDSNAAAAAGYCVIPLASILRDEELVPNWANKDSEQYYVSGLSWRKHSPDMRTIPHKMATSKHAKRYRYDQGIITEQASG
ncbi:hypothetical protein QJQ45_029959 [Haematococcus lacustris]|nr:hypothetical protein QJQ45_020214 [Haematococcus lacustris]KAJ9520020.1 hypothetical protein QJQ45_029959 [Haematococcus lacustris]